MTTLADLITRCATDLGDPSNTLWNTTVLTNFIRQALARYNNAAPRHLATTIDSIAGQREYDVTALSPATITSVWYPWDAANPGHPPTPRRFLMLTDTTLYIEAIPTGGTDDIRILYTAPHTISGLDAATATTLTPDAEALIELLASALAGMERAQYSTGRVTVHAWTPRQLLEWATERYNQAEAQLKALASTRSLAAGGTEHWAQ
jgi:hypothetical protein